MTDDRQWKAIELRKWRERRKSWTKSGFRTGYRGPQRPLWEKQFGVAGSWSEKRKTLGGVQYFSYDGPLLKLEKMRFMLADRPKTRKNTF